MPTKSRISFALVYLGRTGTNQDIIQEFAHRLFKDPKLFISTLD